MQNVFDKNNLQDTEVFTGIISSSTATASNSKIFDTVMDPPASLSVSVAASSPISGYQLIDMSILAHAFVLLSFRGCHGIQCLKLCNSVALLVYIATHFSSRNRLIYRRKAKEDKNFMMRMLELSIDIDKLALVMNIKNTFLLLEYN